MVCGLWSVVCGLLLAIITARVDEDAPDTGTPVASWGWWKPSSGSCQVITSEQWEETARE